MLIKKLLFLTFLVMCFAKSDALRILGIFPHTGESHIYVFKPLMKELVQRGHQVTVISHFPMSESVDNYTDISLKGSLPIMKNVMDMQLLFYSNRLQKHFKLLSMYDQFLGVGVESCEAMLSNEQVKNIKKGDFDVLVIEHFVSDCGLGIAHRLQVPFVGISAHVPTPFSPSRMGLIDPKFLVRGQFEESLTDQNVFERLWSLALNSMGKLVFRFMAQRKEQALLKKHYGEDFPDLETIAKSTSVSLLYTYHTFNGVFSFPPNVVEIGGLHIAPEKKLEAGIQKFLDESTQGVIIFSMGSMIKETTWPLKLLDAFLDAFALIPYKVLWKWGDENIKRVPQNVNIIKWMPQTDILRHKNVKAFITHAGLLSLTEALHLGVPSITIPLFGDQFNNAARAEDAGFGIYMDISNITREGILWAINEAFSPRMQQQAKRASNLFNDRPISAMDTAVYWIEHAHRNGGKHLRDPDGNTCFFKLMLLDIIGLILLGILISYYSMKCIVKRVCMKTSKRKRE